MKKSKTVDPRCNFLEFIFASLLPQFLSLLTVKTSLLFFTLVFKIFSDPGLHKIGHPSLVFFGSKMAPFEMMA